MSRRPGQPLLGKWSRRAILLAAFVSVGTLIGSLLYGSKLTPLAPTQSDSYGYGPVGHHAFAETMKRLGFHVVQSRGDRFEGPRAPMLFIEPMAKARVEGKEQRLDDALIGRSDEGRPSIVVLPKWSLFGGAAEPFISTREDDAEEVLDAALPRDVVSDKPRTHRLGADADTHQDLYGVLGTFTVDVPRLQVITNVPNLATVLLESAHGAVVVVAPDGTVVVSEPDLLHNFNLHRADHAALWWTLLSDYQADTLVIDEVFHGHGKRHRLGEAFGEFPAVLIVVHLLLLLLLLVMLGSRRFGPPLPGFRYGHGPREAIGVAAHVLADGQPVPALVEEYVAQVLVDLHERLGLAAKGTLEDRALAIDEVASHRSQPPEALELLKRSRGLGSSRAQRAEGWRVARAVHAFRARMLGQVPNDEGAPAPENDGPKNDERAGDAPRTDPGEERAA